MPAGVGTHRSQDGRSERLRPFRTKPLRRRAQNQASLGVEHFGQTGIILHLHRHYQIDADPIVDMPSGDLGDANLTARLKERLVTYKLPKSIELVREPLRDDAGKTRRKALREARV